MVNIWTDSQAPSLYSQTLCQYVAYVLNFLCESTQNQAQSCYLYTPMASYGCTTPTVPSEIARISPTSPIPTFLVLGQET